MKITISRLRQDIYRILDSVLKTGKPIEIERNGQLIRITAVRPPKKLAALETREVMATDPEAFVHADWSKEWKPKIK